MKSKLNFKNILSTIGFMFLIIALGSYLISSIKVRRGYQYLPTVFGLTGVTIETGSMAPIADVGDYVLIKLPNIEDIEIGDIITFIDKNNILVTHRVDEIINESGQIGFSTKGDANNTVDKNIVYIDKIVGVGVLVIPKLGLMFKWITSTTGMIVIGAIILALYFFPDKKIKNNKKIDQNNDTNVISD